MNYELYVASPCKVEIKVTPATLGFKLAVHHMNKKVAVSPACIAALQLLTAERFVHRSLM